MGRASHRHGEKAAQLGFELGFELWRSRLFGSVLGCLLREESVGQVTITHPDEPLC